MSKKPNPLALHIDEIQRTIPAFKTRRAIARALLMKESTFSKSVQEEGKLTVAQCLMLAGITGGSFAGVLRLAGHPDLARHADERFRPAGELRLSRWERELIEEWRGSTETDRHALFAVARQLRRARADVLSGSSPRARKRLQAHEGAMGRAVEKAKRRTNKKK